MASQKTKTTTTVEANGYKTGQCKYYCKEVSECDAQLTSIGRKLCHRLSYVANSRWPRCHRRHVELIWPGVGPKPKSPGASFDDLCNGGVLNT
uniref:Uncharacterized protein n=1 Tax=Vespula pensylvanica TaxID=30213 RepID=A0A834N746_VESPE|nr:hypothetical protein H0235_016203 [Vespula pensylvanica]